MTHSQPPRVQGRSSAPSGCQWARGGLGVGCVVEKRESTMNATSYSFHHQMSARPKAHATAMLFSVLRWLLGTLLTLILVLPLLLLFVNTAVPWMLTVGLLAVDGGLGLTLLRRRNPWRLASFFLGLLVVALLAVWLSQAFAATSPIRAADGQPLPNSIATLEKVTLGGSEQWITIRGHDVNKPVLLYLGIGGPGAGGMPANAMMFRQLEEHFVVVNWDQPGTGKSYGAVPIATLTVDRFVADAHELTELLRARFQQEKIYVFGLSWGTILGTKLVQQYPELFYAYVGNGQMVNTTENDRLGYELALQLADEWDETRTFDTLRRNGPPPYDGPGMALKYATYNNVLFRHMESPTLELVLLLVPQFAREYGLVDRVNFARGLLDSFPVVYAQLHDLDFETQAPQLDLPVYFLVGREDVNAMASLVERYHDGLQAPHKELIWLESGHGATPAELADVLVHKVLVHSPPQPPAERSVPNVTDPQAVAAFFDDLLSAQLRDYHIAGAAVALVKDDQLYFAKGYGYVEAVEQQPVVAEQTLFHTDSTGKLFVWTAIMQLAEAGKVDLDADVNSYLDFSIPATFDQPITLKHLMSHSAGFEDVGYLFTKNASELEPTGRWLAQHIPTRVRAPDVVSGYSNYGTALAAYIVERVAGLPFDQYVEEQIFQPLAMMHSTLSQPLPAALAADLTTNYRYVNGRFNAQPAIYVRVPAGEAYTTVTDMAKFMAAHLQDGDSPILHAAAAQQMHSQLFAHHPLVSGMAYGFAESTQNGEAILRHEGNLEGVSSSALFLLPAHQLGVYAAYNSNGGFGPGEQLRSAFLDHFFPVEAPPPRPVALTAEQIDQLSGSYRSTRLFYTSFAKVTTLLGGNYGDIQVVAGANGTFTTQGLGASALRWTPISPQVLQLTDGALNSYGNLVFGADQAGRITQLFVSNNPYRAYEKVAWYASANLHLLWLGICEALFLALLLSSVLLWVMRRLRCSAPAAAPNDLIQWLLVGVCILALLFPLGLVMTLADALLYGVTGVLLGVLTVPLAAIALTGLLLFVIVQRWRSIHGAVRLQTSLLLVAMGSFIGWLSYWNLLGWRL